MKGLPYSLTRSPVSEKVLAPKVINVDATFSVAVGTPARGSVKLGAFPAGNVLFLGGVARLKFSCPSANISPVFIGDFSVGSSADVDGNLTNAADQAIISAGRFSGPAVAGVTPWLNGYSLVASSGNIWEDLTGVGLTYEAFLNLTIDTAMVTGPVNNMRVQGYLSLLYSNLGTDVA